MNTSRPFPNMAYFSLQDIPFHRLKQHILKAKTAYLVKVLINRMLTRVTVTVNHDREIYIRHVGTDSRMMSALYAEKVLLVNEIWGKDVRQIPPLYSMKRLGFVTN